jgi:hypothetical protein
MKSYRNYYISTLLLLVTFFGACQTDTTDPDEPFTPTPIGNGETGIIGTAGVSYWDNLSDTEKNKIKGWNALFLHQSVGQDLEEGCKANGFPFEYYGNGSSMEGLMGGIFVDVGGIANGDAAEKIRVFKEQIMANKDVVQIAIFKFGYGDIDDNNYTQVQTAYQNMVTTLKNDLPNLRFVHVTPPLVYSVEPYDGNAARMLVGEWMRTTFAATDVIFDLQALESNDGTCQENGVWRICTENRNTAADPSDVNDIDTSDGQGHIGKNAGKRISKAFLTSIYKAGK